MKKILFIIAFMLSVVMANAQVYTYRSYAYAQKDAGYNWSNFVKSDLKITINLNTDIIRIYNKLNSTFIVQTSRQYYDSDGEWVMECNCRDEESLRCTIRLVVRNSGTSQMYVDYSNVSWCYNIVKVNY